MSTMKVTDAAVLGMQAKLRDAWTPAMYAALQNGMEEKCGNAWPKWAEQPIFMPPTLREKITGAAMSIANDLKALDIPARRIDAVPESFQTLLPANPLPKTLLIDFAVVENPETKNLDVKLIELQGAANYFFQTQAQAQTWVELLKGVPGIPQAWEWTLNGSNHEGFTALMRDCILGTHRPEECAMVDVDLESQHFHTDFVATARALGIPVIDAEDLIQINDKLYRRPTELGGALIEIKRLYNRVIGDEVASKKIVLPFDFTTLDIEMFPNPADQYRWAKGVMVYLKDHPSVPKTTVLSEVPADVLSGDLSGFVLKRAEGFGGNAVITDITLDSLSGIPEAERNQWLMQEKVKYAHWVTPCGEDPRPIGTEVRVVMVRRDEDTEMTPAYLWVRASRGKMFNAGFNKTETGVGVTLGMWPK